MEKKEKASSFPCQKASSFPCHLWFKQIWLPNEFHILCSIRLSSKLWWKVGSYQVGVFGLSSLAAGCPSTSCSEYPKIIKKSMQSFPLQSLFVSSAFRKIACFIPKKNLETMTLSQSSCHLAVPEREELSPKDLELMARDPRYALATRASICIRHQVIDRRWMGRQASEQRMVCIYLMWVFVPRSSWTWPNTPLSLHYMLTHSPDWIWSAKFWAPQRRDWQTRTARMIRGRMTR